MEPAVIGPIASLELFLCPLCGEWVNPGDLILAQNDPWPEYARHMRAWAHYGCWQTWRTTQPEERSDGNP